MFARYFVELPLPLDGLESALTDAPTGWMPGLATQAQSHGDRLLAEVGFGDAIRISRKVEIELGPPMRSTTKTVIPLRWHATEVAGLFPSLDADLEIAPLGPHRTQLAMSARYVPPLGMVGKALDRAILSRVAEATLKDFLDRVREALLTGASSGVNRLPPGIRMRLHA